MTNKNTKLGEGRGGEGWLNREEGLIEDLR